MFKVFISRGLMRNSRRHNTNTGSNMSIQDLLANLEPGTEVNVHTSEQIHYNALFLAYDRINRKVSFLTDRFYKQGNRLTVLNINEIASLDLPVASNLQEKVDEEDE